MPLRRPSTKLLVAVAVIAVSVSMLTLYRNRRIAEQRQRILASFQPLNVVLRGDTIDVFDRGLGHVALTGVEVESGKDRLFLRSQEVKWGTRRWRQVSWTISRPKTALNIGFYEASQPTTNLTFFPSANGASQWIFDVGRQPLGAVVEHWGFAKTNRLVETQITSVMTMVVPDASAQPVYVTVQAVLDRWPLPNWPEALALFGRTASVGARLVAGDDGNQWDIVRAEVSTGVFQLQGNGTLFLSPFPHLSVSVQGRRTCAQLGAVLAPSEVRRKVLDYLARHAQTAGPTPEAGSVELTLQLDVEDGPTPSGRLRFWQSSGCGIDERSAALP
jgi:hypothetical protein